VLSLAACAPDIGRREAPAAPERVAASQAPQVSEQLRALGYVQPAAPGTGAANATTEAPPSALGALTASRKLIRTGKLSLEVPAYEAAAEAVARIADGEGGYVAGSQSASAGARRARGSVTVRVPAERFPTAIAALKALGKLESEAVSTEDVTKAYADLETRLRVKRETEARLRDVLKNRAAKLGEILEVERELARVIEEIERAEGERRYYDQQVALSTIVVELREPEAAGRTTSWTSLTTALEEALSILARSTAAIVYLVVGGLPWVLVGLVGYAAARRVNRWSAARSKRRPPV
jgi:hypothetical protein